DTLLFNLLLRPDSDPLSLHDALPIYPNAKEPAPPADAEVETSGTSARVFMSITAAGDTLAPADRALTLYPRYTAAQPQPGASVRSEEHTSELQSRSDLVCRLLLEKKK